jgi:hypothetical protein
MLEILLQIEPKVQARLKKSMEPERSWSKLS